MPHEGLNSQYLQRLAETTDEFQNVFTGRLNDLTSRVDRLQAMSERPPDGRSVPRKTGERHPLAAAGLPVLTKSQRLFDTTDHKLPSGVQADELCWGRLLKGVVSGDWRDAAAEKKSLSVADSTAGGYLVPSALSSRVIDLARNRAAVLQAGAGTFVMEVPELYLARVDKDPVFSWRIEHAPIPGSEPEFGRIRMSARVVGALVRMSVELAEDAKNLGNILETALGAALALELDRVALFGSGAGPEPQGIYTADRGLAGGVLEVSAGENGAAPTYELFSQAAEALEGANAVGPFSAIYSPRTKYALERILDQDDNPRRPFQSFTDMQRFATNQVPNNLTWGSASNASAAIVGDFSNLLYGVRTQMTMEASRVGTVDSQEAFERLQILVRVYLRCDVAILRRNHFAVIGGLIPPVG
jgi:HK97 family phage major capsid protein